MRDLIGYVVCWLVFGGIALIFIWIATASDYDDGICAKAGGIRVRAQSGYACVKPIDLERN